jgi:hypothetical protein
MNNISRVPRGLNAPPLPLPPPPPLPVLLRAERGGVNRADVQLESTEDAVMSQVMFRVGRDSMWDSL